MDGLLIRQPWIELILNGEKIWELRGSRTKKRGKIALIQSGTGKIFGVCDLIGVEGPLSKQQLVATYEKHRVPPSSFTGKWRYKTTYAWVLSDARRCPEPIPYSHPSGAVIWVNLAEHPLVKTLENC